MLASCAFKYAVAFVGIVRLNYFDYNIVVTERFAILRSAYFTLCPFGAGSLSSGMLTFGYRSRYNVRLHRNSRRYSIAVGKTAVVPARCEIFERQLSVRSALYLCFVAVFINGDPLISNLCINLV